MSENEKNNMAQELTDDRIEEVAGGLPVFIEGEAKKKPPTSRHEADSAPNSNRRGPIVIHM